jgi:murein DD-endopeptidase MepM/ murein hydrolase activator NlpD
MKRLVSTILIATFIAFCAVLVPPQPALAAPLAPALSVTVAPLEVVPGQAGYVFVGGAYPLDVSIKLDGQPLDVYWTGDGYLALFAFGLDAVPGDHRAIITASDPATGAMLTRSETITVAAFEYPREEVSLSRRIAPLLDPTLNENETAWLDSVYSGRSNNTDWGWPFVVPVPGEMITSRFGGFRTYNGGLWQAYHTGVDFRRGVGEPIWSAASGRVAAVQALEVRGNVVIIDHGYGIFTQYAHCSEVYVQPGQYVQRLQLIAGAGATGRTNGAHLHFELVINGVTVDPLRWLALMPGFVPPLDAPNRDEPIEEGAGD